MATEQVPYAAASVESFAVNQPQNGTRATVFNLTKAAMKLNRFKNWSGAPSGGKFPENIGAGGNIRFTHTKDGSFGSKAAVVYDGFNASNNPCSWVLAWEAPANTDVAQNKVYLRCGRKGDIAKMDFDQILEELDNSTAAADVSDSQTSTSADSTITDAVSNTATLLANFTLM